MDVVYTQLSELISPQAPASVSEWHGAVTGGVVGGARGSIDHWLRLCFGADWRDHWVDDQRTQEVLEEVERELRGQLARDQMEFELALPVDETPLEDRTRAVAEWCSGFLHGFGLAFNSEQGLGEDIRAILSDLAEISKAEIGDPLVDESHEVAYTEIVEYVRVAIQNVYEALSPERELRGDVH